MLNPPVATPIIVSLKQVASWDLEYLHTQQSEMKVSVPALQRGLVWSPQQVEFLWDSILRGFPIGCLVVSKRVKSQERSGKNDITHHLLDGQQRANAITLGFHDPFDDASGKVRDNTSEAILWLDLAPLGIPSFPDSQFSRNSTRQFLTRVTTLSHPWGYQPDDTASRLSAGDAREAIEWEFKDKTKPAKKPSSLDLLPWRSNAPIPISWLLDAYDKTQENDVNAEENMWRLVKTHLELESKRRRWPTLALEAIAQSDNLLNLHEIYQAIHRAAHTELVIIEAPNDILKKSRQEISTQAETSDSIASIEHLFNRLNGQGTKLDGEELAYSMVKAYWPNVADEIEFIRPRRLPASHLVSLAVRCALTEPGANKLARSVGIPKLRSIAAAVSNEPDRILIEEFLNQGSIKDKRRHRLARACQSVEEWLSYRDDSRNGLPPVLVSSVARGSSDFYLFLLHIADRLSSESHIQDKKWNTLLPGVATLIHWFSVSDGKPEIADILMAAISKSISPDNIALGIVTAINKNLIITPLSPDELEHAIQLPDDLQINSWQWKPSLIESHPESVRTELERKLWPVLERTRGQRELLLYAHRDFLNNQFSDYDPSRKDLWEGHNRPWDFDHLHAGFYVWGKQGAYADYCREWVNCIGNLRVWPFELNRSDQKDTAEEKFADEINGMSKVEKMKWSLIAAESEIANFSFANRARHETAAARALSAAIKARYIRIYKDWYDSTSIETLFVSLKTQSNTNIFSQANRDATQAVAPT